MPWMFEQFTLDRASTFDLDPALEGVLATHGAPNGSEYFKFLELAFACIEYGINPDFWSIYLMPMLRSTHCFAEFTDQPAPGTAKMTTANALAYRPGRTLSTQRREELHKEYDDLVLLGTTAGDVILLLEERFTSILAQVLSDTPDYGDAGFGQRDLRAAAVATIIRSSSRPSVP